MTPRPSSGRCRNKLLKPDQQCAGPHGPARCYTELVLRQLIESAGSWALWKGLDWAWNHYFEHSYGNTPPDTEELSRQLAKLTPEHRLALEDLTRPRSEFRCVVEEILAQEFPDADTATEYLCRQFARLSRPETEILLGLMILGKRKVPGGSEA